MQHKVVLQSAEHFTGAPAWLQIQLGAVLNFGAPKAPGPPLALLSSMQGAGGQYQWWSRRLGLPQIPSALQAGRLQIP